MAWDFEVIVHPDGAQWYGWVADVPGVNCQEEDAGKLMKSLEEGLREALWLNQLEAKQAVDGTYSVVQIRI